MKRRLLFGTLVLGVLLLALLGWTVGTLRWTLTGRRKRRETFAPALTV